MLEEEHLKVCPIFEMILFYLDSWKLPKGFKGGGGGKNEEIFPVGKWGKQKIFLCCRDFSGKEGWPAAASVQGEFPHLGKHGHN